MTAHNSPQRRRDRGGKEFSIKIKILSVLCISAVSCYRLANPWFFFKENKGVVMRYEGPIYRPPSETNALLIQATIVCPHNRCTFCMVYKNGPRYRVRPVDDKPRLLDEISRALERDESGFRPFFIGNE